MRMKNTADASMLLRELLQVTEALFAHIKATKGKTSHIGAHRTSWKSPGLRLDKQTFRFLQYFQQYFNVFCNKQTVNNDS